MNQTRIGAGVPSGGQFATAVRPETGLSLDGPEALDHSGVVGCPHCAGHAGVCAFCGGLGLVEQRDADDYFRPRVEPDDETEPDYAAILEERYERWDNGRGEAMEWGGVDW